MRTLLLLGIVSVCLGLISPPTITGCTPGSADLRIRVTTEGIYTTIPAGIVGLEVLMSALPYDVDLLLYTATNKPVVAPCGWQGRCTALVGDQGPSSKAWGNAHISYSGYGGIHQQGGVEQVVFAGALPEGLKIGFHLNFPSSAVGVPVAIQLRWKGAAGCTTISTSQGLDLMQSTNTIQHETDLYRGIPESTLVLRRGFPFTFTVNLPKAKASNTKITSTELDAIPGALTFTYTDNGGLVSITGTIAPNAPVGAYNLTVAAGEQNTLITLVILFNPWCEKDETYLPDTADRTEFVENEEGFIWQGSVSQTTANIFDYGQFEWAVLYSAVRLLRRMPVAERSSIVLVSRHLSYAVNADMCYGKWDTDPPYESGTPEDGYTCWQTSAHVCRTPTNWRKMLDLVQVHIATGFQRAQYCQCFVYAALSTGIGRSLGIPTRPVTNFQSAHDKNSNRAIDKFYVKSGNGLTPTDGPDGFEESVWNFHVWNEMWMKRSDIDATYCTDIGETSGCGDGWQAVDATPQELSEGGSGTPSGQGFYMMGPAPIRLVKDNKHQVCHIDALSRDTDPRVGCYDTNFVISEVNANINIWVQNGSDWVQQCYNGQQGDKCGYPTDPMTASATPGQLLSTKLAGTISDKCRQTYDCTGERYDRTLAYKNAEPSWSTTRGRKMWVQAGEGNAEISVGLIPGTLPKIINYLGSIWSAASVVVKVTAEPGSTVECHSTVTAHTYTDKLIKKTMDASTIARSSLTAIPVGSDGKAQCLFTVSRSEYKDFVSSSLEAAAKASHLKFHMSVVVISPTKQKKTYLEERAVDICTPVKPLDLLNGKEVTCEDNRGTWTPVTRPTCPDDNSKIGDGKCDDELNTEANCYDNGDCCPASCVGRTAGVDGMVAACPTTDEKCIDPAFQFGFNEPTKPASGKSDSGADVTCSEVATKVSTALAKAGCLKQSKCSTTCAAALQSTVCNNRLMNWRCSELTTILTSSSCSWPRCKQSKKGHGIGFVWAFPKASSGVEDMLTNAEWASLRAQKTEEKQTTQRKKHSDSSKLGWLAAGSIGTVVGVVIGMVVSQRRRSTQMSMI